MRLILSFFFALQLCPAWAQTYSTTVVRCLGLEEAQFHKTKKMGALFDLNQKMIGEVTQLMNTDAKPEYKKKICMAQSPSWAMLEVLLLDPKNWWVIEAETLQKQPYLSKELVNELNELSFELFIHFIQALQIDAPMAGCLENKVPELKPLFYKVKYLQEDVSTKDLLPNHATLTLIFKKLDSPQKIYDECWIENQKKIKSKKK